MRRLVESAGVLKLLPRTGWLLRGVPPAVAETVAGHVFEAALTALIVSHRLLENGVRVDLARVLAMALLHDVEEAVTGDVVKPVKERVSGLDAVRREALEKLSLGDDLSRLLEEYEGLGTLEAVVVKFSELVATLNQACRYVGAGYTGVKDLVESVYREALSVAGRAGGAGRVLEKLLEELALCRP